MNTVKDLKAIITVSECGNVNVFAEISGNDMFKEDISTFNGYADDIFYELTLPDEFGFYLFIGQADCGIDDDGNIDDVKYSGEFNKIAASTLSLYLTTTKIRINMSTNEHRGHNINVNKDAEWVYSDTKQLVSENPVRSCGSCGKNQTEKGYDGCLDELPCVMNACCGHGVLSKCYVQFNDGSTINGNEALYFQKKHKVHTVPAYTKENAHKRPVKKEESTHELLLKMKIASNEVTIAALNIANDAVNGDYLTIDKCIEYLCKNSENINDIQMDKIDHLSYMWNQL